jgi:hypothetical protein
MAKIFEAGHGKQSGRGKIPVRWITVRGNRVPIYSSELPGEEGELSQEFLRRRSERAHSPAQEFEKNVGDTVKGFADSMQASLATTRAFAPGPLGRIANILAIGNVATSAAQMAQDIRNSKTYYKKISYAGEQKRMGQIAEEIEKFTSAKEKLEDDLRHASGQRKFEIQKELAEREKALEKRREEVKESLRNLSHPRYKEWMDKSHPVLGPKGYEAFSKPMTFDEIEKRREEAVLHTEILDRAEKVGSEILAADEIARERRSDHERLQRRGTVDDIALAHLRKSVAEEHQKRFLQLKHPEARLVKSGHRIIEVPKK